MTKLDKFLESLDGYEVEAPNGDIGYLVTLGELIDNGGRSEFLRKVRRKKDGSFSVSRDVYTDLEYDRAEKAWYADCYTNICYHSGPMQRENVVFIGFTF